MKPFIYTYSGNKFYPEKPDPSHINLEDIAHALSNICRFTGHTKEFYSVAEHSVNVSLTCDQRFAYKALMHDAPEAYINDLSRPLKEGLERYRAIEKAVWEAICVKFNMLEEIPYEVKESDDWWLRQEGHHLLSAKHWPNPEIPRDRLKCYSPRDAERAFLDRFDSIVDSFEHRDRG